MADIVGAVFGWMGFAICLFFFFSPVVLFRKLMTGKITYQQIPGVMFVCNILQNLLGTAYGLRYGEIQMWLANGLGGAITLVWLVIYIIYFAKKQVLPSIVYLIIFADICIEIFYIFYSMIEDLQIVAYVGMGTNILMYAGPGQNLFTVFKTHNYDLIPILSSIFVLANSICWTIYGIYLALPNVYVPNLIGLALVLIQIVMWIYCKKYYPKTAEDYRKEEENVKKEVERSKKIIEFEKNIANMDLSKLGEIEEGKEKGDNIAKKPSRDIELVINCTEAQKGKKTEGPQATENANLNANRISAL